MPFLLHPRMQRIIEMAGVTKAELAILEERRRVTAQKERAEARQNQDDEEKRPHEGPRPGADRPSPAAIVLSSR